jgi:hypothetical protein
MIDVTDEDQSSLISNPKANHHHKKLDCKTYFKKTCYKTSDNCYRDHVTTENSGYWITW